MAPDTDALLLRLDSLESKLDAVLQALAAEGPNPWIDRRSTCQLLAISERQLLHLLREGAIGGGAVRNIGTPQRPRYRFHRRQVLEQYLSRSNLVRRPEAAAS